MKFLPIILLLLVSCKKINKDTEDIIKSGAASKSYKIFGDISHNDEKGIISLLTQNQSRKLVTKLTKLDENFVQVSIKINEEDFISYVVEKKENEWHIVSNSPYKIIEGFTILHEINRDDIGQIIETLKNIKAILPDWEISKGKNGIIKAHNYDESSDALGNIYKLKKTQKVWHIISRASYDN